MAHRGAPRRRGWRTGRPHPDQRRRIEEVGVGGVEVIGYNPATGIYRCHFFDSQGNASEQTLAADGDTWLWQGEEARCTGIFSDDGRTLTAHHERRAADGWVPSMEVVLNKIN